MSVSLVICCHNSAQRLPETLAHLRAQKAPDDLAWEVIVVDNASTDDTAKVARALWPDDAPVPLRVVREPRVGLSYARQRGIAEALHEVISFIDDDNWVCAQWVQRVAEIMREHPEAGACGGAVEAVPEGEMPAWFARYQEQYAVGTQAETTGDVTDDRGWLWGAGLTVRSRAIRRLQASGFRSLLEDRRGTSLSAGGDIELCYALRLSGWRLWYDPRLRLKHFLPAQRLTWHYLRRMCRGSGASTVGRDAYRFAWERTRAGANSPWLRTWQAQALLATARLVKQGVVFLKTPGPLEGHPAVISAERQVGRLIELLRWRGAYDAAIDAVREWSCSALADSNV